MKQDPRPGMLRRVIIDMLPYAVSDAEILTMQDRLGLVPSSLDVLELERKESNTRIATIKPISGALTQMAQYSAEAIAEYFLMQIDGGDEDDEDDDDEGEGIPIDYLRNVIVNQNRNVIATAVHGIISHLVASGVLVFNKELQ